MTVIRLDAAAVALLKTATGEVVFADASGNPVRRFALPPGPDREPELTEGERAEIDTDPVIYSLTEAREKIRRRETL